MGNVSTFRLPFWLGLAGRMGRIVAYIQKQWIILFMASFMFLKYIHFPDLFSIILILSHVDKNFDHENMYMTSFFILTLIRSMEVSVIARVACLGSAL